MIQHFHVLLSTHQDCALNPLCLFMCSIKYWYQYGLADIYCILRLWSKVKCFYLFVCSSCSSLTIESLSGDPCVFSACSFFFFKHFIVFCFVLFLHDKTLILCFPCPALKSATTVESLGPSYWRTVFRYRFIYRLNILGPLEIHMLNPSAWCGDIWMWTLWEVMRAWGGSPYTRHPRENLWGHNKKMAICEQGGPSLDTINWQLDLEFASLKNCKK